MPAIAILNSPLVDLGAVVGVLILLSSLGFDVKGMFRRFIGTDAVGDVSPPKEQVASLRNDFQSLLTQMESLTQYANHETTDMLNRVHGSMNVLHGKLDEHVRQQDRTNYLLEDIKTNGIKCRNT